MYVLATNGKLYFTEYRLNEIRMSHSITEAMIFEEKEYIAAQTFQKTNPGTI